MAERKSGPVKPPTIDLTPARSAGSARPPRAVRTGPPEPGEDAVQAPGPIETPAGIEGILSGGQAPAEPDAPLSEAANLSEPDAAPQPRDEAPMLETSAAEAAEPEHTPPPAESRHAEPAAASAQEVPPRPRAAPPPPRMPNAPLYITAVAGALIGTVMTLGLAGLGLFPSPAPVQLADPGLGAQAERIDALEQRAAAREGEMSTAIATLDERLAADTDALALLRAELEPLRAEIETLRAGIPAATDLAPVSAEIATLSGRIDALAAGAPAADAGAFASTLGALQQSVSALDQQVADLTAAQEALSQGAASIDGRLAALESSAATPAADIAEAAPPATPAPLAPSSAEAASRLPLVISGLDSAFASGRPFATELEALGPLLPELAVPEGLASAAATGLPRPAALMAAFDDAVPEMIAAQPSEGSADWQQTAIDWMASLLALRSTEEREGDTPDAVLSRLEGAMRRGDFSAAEPLFAALPEPMRAAAGPVPSQVSLAAAADRLVADLRRAALQPVATLEGSAQ